MADTDTRATTTERQRINNVYRDNPITAHPKRHTLVDYRRRRVISIATRPRPTKIGPPLPDVLQPPPLPPPESPFGQHTPPVAPVDRQPKLLGHVFGPVVLHGSTQYMFVPSLAH